MPKIRAWTRQWSEGLYDLAIGVDIGKFKIYKPGGKWTITLRYGCYGIPGHYIWRAKTAILGTIVAWRVTHRFPRVRRALVHAYHKHIML